MFTWALPWQETAERSVYDLMEISLEDSCEQMQLRSTALHQWKTQDASLKA